jgi:hypothetical protein
MENDYLLSCDVSLVIGVRLLILVTQQHGASGVAYFLIVYEIWIGEAAKLAKAAGGNTLAKILYVGSYL